MVSNKCFDLFFIWFCLLFLFCFLSFSLYLSIVRVVFFLSFFLSFFFVSFRFVSFFLLSFIVSVRFISFLSSCVCFIFFLSFFLYLFIYLFFALLKKESMRSVFFLDNTLEEQYHAKHTTRNAVRRLKKSKFNCPNNYLNVNDLSQSF